MRQLVKNKRVLIIGHADGDGHLAAEQSRRNAIDAGAHSCTLLVDPQITPGYRFWDRHLPELDISAYGLVLFVDLMLNPKRVGVIFASLVARARAESD